MSDAVELCMCGTYCEG